MNIQLSKFYWLNKYKSLTGLDENLLLIPQEWLEYVQNNNTMWITLGGEPPKAAQKIINKIEKEYEKKCEELAQIYQAIKVISTTRSSPGEEKNARRFWTDFFDLKLDPSKIWGFSQISNIYGVPEHLSSILENKRYQGSNHEKFLQFFIETSLTELEKTD